jgi:hypothetical protein
MILGFLHLLTIAIPTEVAIYQSDEIVNEKNTKRPASVYLRLEPLE